MARFSSSDLDLYTRGFSWRALYGFTGFRLLTPVFKMYMIYEFCILAVFYLNAMYTKHNWKRFRGAPWFPKFLILNTLYSYAPRFRFSITKQPWASVRLFLPLLVKRLVSVCLDSCLTTLLSHEVEHWADRVPGVDRIQLVQRCVHNVPRIKIATQMIVLFLIDLLWHMARIRIL